MAWYDSIWRNENCKRFCQCSCIISHLPPILHWMFTTRKCQIHDNFNFANLRIHSSIPFLFTFQFTNIFYTAAFRLHQSQQSMEQPSWQIEGRQSECHQGSNGEENHAAGIRWKMTRCRHSLCDTVRDMALASPLLWLICVNLLRTFSWTSSDLC